jgi:hypothetical protein
MRSRAFAAKPIVGVGRSVLLLRTHMIRTEVNTVREELYDYFAIIETYDHHRLVLLPSVWFRSLGFLQYSMLV